MGYLGLALFAEGATDHRFLAPVLRRTTEETCLVLGDSRVELGEVHELHSPTRFLHEDRAIRICEAARGAWGAFDILFIHTHGAGDPDVARAERVEPAIGRIVSELAHGRERMVGVVPVRETEAWALADGALREAFGTVLGDPELGIPGRPRDVEGVLDPKLVLEQALGRVVGRRRRKKKTAAAFLDAIGERVRLTRLRQIPAFRRFERELHEALLSLGYLKRA